jgi:hypothetical protein
MATVICTVCPLFIVTGEKAGVDVAVALVNDAAPALALPAAQLAGLIVLGAVKLVVSETQKPLIVDTEVIVPA